LKFMNHLCYYHLTSRLNCWCKYVVLSISVSGAMSKLVFVILGAVRLEWWNSFYFVFVSKSKQFFTWKYRLFLKKSQKNSQRNLLLRKPNIFTYFNEKVIPYIYNSRSTNEKFWRGRTANYFSIGTCIFVLLRKEIDWDSLKVSPKSIERKSCIEFFFLNLKFVKWINIAFNMRCTKQLL